MVFDDARFICSFKEGTGLLSDLEEMHKYFLEEVSDV